MANVCDICGKMRQVGHHVSHSNIKTLRTFGANLQKVRCQLPSGEVKTISACTTCIRSGKVTKPKARPKQPA